MIVLWKEIAFFLAFIGNLSSFWDPHLAQVLNPLRDGDCFEIWQKLLNAFSRKTHTHLRTHTPLEYNFRIIRDP